jgi:cytochrome oxidase Cu insertion factor (SCO1/SenC/PrrC family)
MRGELIRVCGAALIAGIVGAGTVGAEEARPERLQGVDRRTLAPTYALGPFEPSYEPPAPGSYALPVIRRVEDHPLVDADGRAATLDALTDGRLTVIAFIYTTCVEAVGCPVSHAVLHRLDRALGEDPALQARVTLITLSFDPDRDTPERMAAQRDLHQPRSRWYFVTTSGGAPLERLLADFDQQVDKLRYEDGTWSGLYRHVLKVFLLDPRRRVRAIYSTGFLNQALVLNDLKTLAAEEGAGPK